MHEAAIHQAQILILRELLFVESARFSELQKPTGLDSDHFKYHLAKLVELGFVQKLEQTEGYSLTQRGKEHANKLDTEARAIERQPKLAVLLLVERESDNGQKEYLFQQRLKHPYYKFWGIPGGKIGWGETVFQAAARELEEETGLQADIEFVGVYHEHTSSDKDGELLEDKMFFVMKCSNHRGEFVTEFEGGKNKFMTAEATKTLQKKYNSFDFELDFALGKTKQQGLVEKQQFYAKDEF